MSKEIFLLLKKIEIKANLPCSESPIVLDRILMKQIKSAIFAFNFYSVLHNIFKDLLRHIFIAQLCRNPRFAELGYLIQSGFVAHFPRLPYWSNYN